MTIRNYSASRDVAGHAQAWLGVAGLRRPPQAVVNGSLTLSEVAFQRCLNVAMGSKASRAGDRLRRWMPPFGAVRPSTAAQKRLWDIVQKDVDALNERIPPGERYDRDRDLARIPAAGARAAGRPAFQAGD